MTDPSKKLEVAGDISCQNLYANGDTTLVGDFYIKNGGTNKFKVNNTNGNVDISGTLNVDEAVTLDNTLTVSGDVDISGTLTIEYDTNDPDFNSDTVNLLVTSYSKDNEDSIITIRGNREFKDNKEQAQLRFENYGGGREATYLLGLQILPAEPREIHTYGAICGVGNGNSSNLGSLKFYTFDDGINGSCCMEMKKSGNIEISNSVSIGSDLTVGNIEISNSVSIGSDLTVGNGVNTLGGPSTYSGTHVNTAFFANNYNNRMTSNCSKIVLRLDNGNQYGAEILGGLWQSNMNSSLTSPLNLEGNQRFAINVMSGGVNESGDDDESNAAITRALSIDKDGIVDIPYLMVGNLNGGTTNTTSELYNVLNSYSATSDDRIKFDEKNVNDCMAVVNELVPFRYNIISKQPDDASGIWMPTDASWNDVSNNFNYKNQYGFIAQDVGDISGLEMLVKGEPLDACGNQTILSLEYNSLFTIGIGAIKELHQLISSQATTISALEARVRILENP